MMPSKKKRPPYPPDFVPEALHIEMYLHCARCIQEVVGQPKTPTTQGESPATYSRLSVGWTKMGLQVWCRRHEANVLHVDFEGQQHPATTNRLKETS